MMQLPSVRIQTPCLILFVSVQMVREAIHHALDDILSSILSSRTTHLGSVQELLKEHFSRSYGPPPSIRIDIMAFRYPDGAIGNPMLVEHWHVQHRRDQHFLGSNGEDLKYQLKKLRKRITVMMRTILSLCRILPAFQVRVLDEPF